VSIRAIRGKNAFLLCVLLRAFKVVSEFNDGNKKAARRGIAVRLGGGGNEACHSRLPGRFRHRNIREDFEPSWLILPGLVRPADRLRAALSVGTNRAS
jgi:hypothetical protein